MNRLSGPGAGRAALLTGATWLTLAFGGQALLAQGRVDPSLPTQPLEYTRTLMIFPGVDTVKDPNAVLPPLTTKQKYQIFWYRTFDRSLLVESLLLSGGSQAINYSPHYGQGWTAFGERFGSYAGSIASSSLFTDAVLPSLFHQDPRYFRMGRGHPVMKRLWYAVYSEALTRNDNGTKGVNISGMLGFGMSTALTNAWYPRQSVTFTDTMTRYGIKVALSVVLNVVREFGGSEQD